jgi:dihydrolipoamide dehydrogenase
MVVGDVTTGTEVLVVGGGPGGYVAAIRAAQRGLDTTLVERDAYGGACLNRGCIPSKAMISAADLAHEAGHAEAMGIHADPAVDAHGLADWRDGIVDRMSGSVEKLCKANGVDLLAGTARFDDDHVARVVHEGEGRGAETVEFEHAVIATGSRPVSLPGFAFDDEPVWDSAAALSVRDLPDRLVVVGAGYIGMELSTAFAKLGVEVTVLEALEDVLPGYEDDVARAVRRRASDLGVEFRFGRAATGWRESADGGIVVRATDEDGEETGHPADRVLVAVGREPVTDTVGLAALGLEPNADGAIETDERTRTDREHVHAVGDVAGEPMLAHVASREGVVAAETIAGEPAAVDNRALPGAVFTDPEVGTVGLTEAEAAEAGHEPVVGQMPFRASGRALTAGPDHAEGFVRIVADGATGTVLGGQIVGPEASELIAEVALAVEMGATLEDVGATIHTHPTLAEAVMEAAENARDQAIHTLNR